MKRSKNILTPALISLSKKGSPLAPNQPSKFGLVKPSDSPQIRNWKILGIWVLVLSFTLPVFRSGGRTELVMWDWVKNHSVFGEPVEYVPEEQYMAEVQGTWIDEEGRLRW